MHKKNIVGSNVRTCRIKAGMTQEELALKSGLSQGYINQLENGKRNYTQKSLELIASALSVTVIDLFKEKGLEQAVSIAEKSEIYQKKRSYEKEFQVLLSNLPEPIANHYLTLLKLEWEMLRNKK
ncbi:MAG: helix-turn-helix transcriptional regulator [Planctomycetota bacterium]